jgi:hypothetical protein
MAVSSHFAPPLRAATFSGQPVKMSVAVGVLATRDKLQDLLGYADGRVDRARKPGREGLISAFCIATAAKSPTPGASAAILATKLARAG